MPGAKYGGKAYDPPLDLLAHAKWGGAEFFEVVSPPRGFSDNNVAEITLAHTIDPLQLRRANHRHFEAHTRQPLVSMPGDDGRFEWKGMATSFILTLSKDLIRKSLNSRGKIQRPPVTSKANETAYLLRLLKFDAVNKSPAGPSVADGIINKIIDSVFHESHLGKSTHRDAVNKIDVLREYIEGNIDQPLHLAELASIVGMSARNMCRAFRSATSLTPHAYILRRRVERARDLISNARGGALSEVSARVGFSSQAHMATAFRKLLSQPPSHFRNSGERRFS